ncbi:protein of unknown function [Methylocella tundrae]|uniref:Transposase n=1 Tax=Methylocella tundrae TaxID=227605 RepID=A0A4U8Z166_METTU|nr:protein of unknown function [Methylocella tundrae]
MRLNQAHLSNGPTPKPFSSQAARVARFGGRLVKAALYEVSAAAVQGRRFLRWRRSKNNGRPPVKRERPLSQMQSDDREVQAAFAKNSRFALA